jgi:hypothetical protein
VFHCKTCDRIVDIKEIKHLDDYDENILSCGHSYRLSIRAPAAEGVPTEDYAARARHLTRNIIDDPQLASSKEIRIEAKNVDDKVPVTVSGDSGVRKEGLLDLNLLFRKQGDIFIVDRPTIYADTVNIGSKDPTTISTNTSVTSTHIFSRNTKIVNISSIIEQVSYSSHSAEEKEKIKSILEELN